MMGRAIVKETTLGEWLKNPAAGNDEEMLTVKVGKGEEVKKKPET